MICGACQIPRFVVRERHPVERHNLKNLPTYLQVYIGVRRGVHDAPELLLFRRDVDLRAHYLIHGKDFAGLLRRTPTWLRWDFDMSPEFG